MTKSGRILLTGSGGPASVGVARSLRKAGGYHLVGTDCSVTSLAFAETHRRYLIPPASRPEYLDAVNEIVVAEQVDVVHPQPDAEVYALSAGRDRLKAKLLLPPHPSVTLCQDKYASALRWAAAGICVPETLLLTTPDDLADAFVRLGQPFWIRSRYGAGGSGSMICRDYAGAKSWVDSHAGWGVFTASELLPGRLTTWQSMWFQGRLICAQGRERLSWAMGRDAAVSGMTGIGRTIARDDIDAIGEATIRAIDPQPHGLYGVDLKENRAGVPCPTEINIGRFFTTIQFFAELGLNMPHLHIQAALTDRAEPLRPPCNPLPPDWLWVRSTDSAPILIHLGQLLKQECIRVEAPTLTPDRTVTYGL